ncbi:hypothetical protein Hanom_Chr11g01045731 [Helianthus anomalus]
MDEQMIPDQNKTTHRRKSEFTNVNSGKISDQLSSVILGFNFQSSNPICFHTALRTLLRSLPFKVLPIPS